MANEQEPLIPENERFFPEGSLIPLVVHVGIGLFFIIVYFLFYSNIETIKMMILGYYTLYSTFFIFFYYKQLRVRRIYTIWVLIAVLQLVFYFFNIHNMQWGKWSFNNVLSTMCGLPVVLVMYQSFQRMSLQQNRRYLFIGIRTEVKASKWDIAATVVIPLVALLICLF